MKIMVAIPSATGMIPLKVMSRLIRLDKPKGSTIDFGYVERLMIDKARNGMVQQAIMHDVDYLFFNDDDQAPDKDILVKMIEVDKDIVGCPIPSRNGKEELAVFDLEFNRLTEFTKTCRVGAVGMASTLIKGSVLKKIVEKYPNPFQFEVTYDKDNVLVEFSEDINFCRRAGEMGFEVWCMADVASIHFGSPVQHIYRDGKYYHGI
jgi:hypothetical protein